MNEMEKNGTLLVNVKQWDYVSLSETRKKNPG